MSDLLSGLAVLAGFALLMAGIWWWGVRARRSGVGTSLLGVADEIWNPAAHRPRLEVQIQVQRKAPPGSPGDPPWRDAR